MKLLESLLFGVLVGLLANFSVYYFGFPTEAVFLVIGFYFIGLIYGGYSIRNALLDSLKTEDTNETK